MITVFTPTYNRAYTLPQLYNSLIMQKNKNFEWLIVDDGSIDNTKELVNKWICDGYINIKYFYQENAGKMMAHNLGVLKSEEELFMCIDSDDFLYDENVIDSIIKKWESIDNKVKIKLAGIVAQKYILNLGYKNIEFPNVEADTLFNLYNKYKFKGETTLIFRTDILKEHLFPHIEGEKFIPESYIYQQIDQKYKLLYYGKYMQRCKYMNDGYTNNFLRVFVNNPKSWKIYYLQKIKYSNNIKDIIITTYRYIGISFIDKNKPSEIISQSEYKLLTLILIPLGYLKSIKDIRAYKSIK